MNKRGLRMTVVAMILFGLLIAKSLWFDPVGTLQGEEEMYRQFVVEMAPIKKPSLLDRWGLLTYRATVVIQEEEDGYTEIMYRSAEDKENWITETIQGQYRAKVRGYILYIIPIKDIRIEGGIS